MEEPNRLNILNCDQSCQFIVINFLCVFIYLISCLARRDLSIFLAVISDTREFCAGERRLITHGGISTRLGVIPSVTPGIYSLCECIMSVIRWLVVQEVCSSFEFARHFESHLAWPPPFYMRMQTQRLPLNIPLLLCYTVHVLYTQPIRLRAKDMQLA